MKYLRVKMSDGSKYDIPVSIIAANRADNYRNDFDGDIDKSLKENTMPLFDSSDYEIEDWAENNMNWSDVKEYATQVVGDEGDDVDFQDGWVNGEKEIIKK